MKISSINKSYVNFSAKCKRDDVVRLLTMDPYLDKKNIKPDLLKILTGEDVYSKEYRTQITDEDWDFIYECALAFQVEDELIAQYPEFSDILCSYDRMLETRKSEKERFDWFKTTLKTLKPNIEIKPFSIDKNKLIEDCQETANFFSGLI